MKDRSHRSLGLRKWLSTATYLDGFFALAERTRVGLRQLFTRALPATDCDWSPRRRKKRSCSLDFERLEDRRMMTTVAFSAPSYSVYDNVGSASITVDPSSSSMSTITVDYATSNGSATAGTDYTAASGTLTFAPASTSQTFSVPVTNDGITSTKTVDLILSSPTNATLGLNNPVVLDLEPVAPTITLSPGTLPAATVGVSYSEQLSASGGTSPYTYAVTGTLGLLPGGISLSSSGLLSGTSTYTSINSFTVTATDSNGFTGNQNYTLDVNTPTITLSPSTLSAATAGTSYSQQLTGGGGDSPYTFTVTTGSLPTGISLSTGGLLSGTGTAVTSATFTVTATDHNSYTGTQSYTLAVGAPNISFNAAGHVIATVDPFGNRATSVFNAAGQVVATIDQFGNITTNIYDAAGNQIATEDYLGNFTTTVFDGAGNVIATIDPYGNHTTFIFNSYGQQVAVEDQYGHFTTTVFDSEGRVSATIDVYGNRTTTIYDSYGRVSATIDYLGNATTTIYDGVGNVLATVDALGNRTTNIYDSFGLQIATEDPNGNFTTTVFDSYGNPIATIDPLGNRTTTVLDSHGREAATIDPLGNRTSTIFDSYGRVSATEDALGHYVTSIFNSYGQVSAAIDPLGNRTTNIFDSTGRQVATEDALGNYTTTVFDSYGRPVATIDPLGNRVTSVYDSHGNVVATIDGLGNATTTVFDSEGRAAAIIDPLGNRTTNIFDAYGRVAAVENPLGNLASTIYDSYGRQVATEDALGHFTTTIFDSYGRPVATIDPLGNRTTTVLDSQGRTVGEIDASGNVTTFVLDALGRVVQTITPLGTTTSTYDADGRLATQTDALGQEILYGYDAVGNDLTQTWKNAGGSVANLLTFTYDSNGRQLTASNNVGTYTIAYNNVGEATAVQGLWGVLLTMTYDSAGNRTLVQDSFGGVTSSVFDANGNLTQEETGGTGLTPMRINLAYNADGELTGETRYSNLAGTTTVATTSIVYDSTGDVTGQLDKTGGGTNIANYTNTYDANREITSEQLNGGAATSFTYDNEGEVTGDGSITESYGATGNRTNTGDTTGSDNELTSDGTWNYSYDDAGNETEKVNIASGVAWTYGYDDKNELVKAQEWSSNPYVYGTAYVEVEVDYKYDPLGNLAETDSYPTGSGSPVVTRYAVDGWNPALAGTTGNTRFNVWADLDGSNNLQTRYLRGNQPDQLFGRVDNAGNAYWTLTDRQGSVRDVIDKSGNVKDAINYDAFGNIISETNSAYRGSYAWTGRQLDVETDLQYNRARWYDPTTGRWQSQDPLGFDAGDSNLYRYVSNNPTNLTDPTGLYEIDVHFYLTYYLTASIGFGKVYTSYNNVRYNYRDLISWAAQQVDADQRLIPENPINATFNVGIQRKIHFNTSSWGSFTPGFRISVLLGSSEPVARSSPYAKAFFNQAVRADDPLLAGAMIHAFQDSFSHAGFYPGIGHAGQPYGGHKPDYPWTDQKKALEMAHETYDLLAAYYRAKTNKNPVTAWPDIEKNLRILFQKVGDEGLIRSYDQRVADLEKKLAGKALVEIYRTVNTTLNQSVWTQETNGRANYWKGALGKILGSPVVVPQFGKGTPCADLLFDSIKQLPDPINWSAPKNQD